MPTCEYVRFLEVGSSHCTAQSWLPTGWQAAYLGYTKKNDIMINKESHSERLWKVNEIANDFNLWDVWQIPIEANNSEAENFKFFYKVVVESFMKMQTRITLASLLFTLRYRLGKVFPLDKNINILPIPDCSETTIIKSLIS